MSKLQTDEKRDLQYKANRELIWGLGLLLMSNQLDEGWLATAMGVVGLISIGLSVFYEWRQRK